MTDAEAGQLTRSVKRLRLLCLGTSIVAVGALALAAWAAWPRKVITLQGDAAKIELVSGTGARRTTLDPYGISILDSTSDSEVRLHAFPLAHMTLDAAGPNGRYPRVYLGVGLQSEGFLSLGGLAEKGARDVQITPDDGWSWIQGYGIQKAREAKELAR